MSTFFPGDDERPDGPAPATDELVTGTEPDPESDPEADFAPRPRPKAGVLTKVLAVVVVAAAGLLVGIVLQKHVGTASAAGRGGGRATANFAGAQGAFGRGQGEAQDDGGGRPSAPATSGTAATPSVIGTITHIAGTVLTVRNLGGATVTVTMSATTVVTAPESGLAVGRIVAVTGRTSSAGHVTATKVVQQ